PRIALVARTKIGYASGTATAAALAAHIDGPCGTERIPRRAAPSASTALTNGAASAAAVAVPLA
ncbi:hypothetical protein, partial [Mycolicibacterium fortuitum]|uniref:hypothetical protein n=1 Tax=Mycolicibacterium fortuitum TaxID=1766 RepID=UPI000A61CC3F